MNVQASVLIWTVINFCILMLLLNKLLFKPLLSFMDARREKIAHARRQREEAIATQADAQKHALDELLAADKNACSEARAALGRMKCAMMQEREKKEKEYALLLEQEKADIDAQRQDVRRELDDGTEALISAFIQKLAL